IDGRGGENEVIYDDTNADNKVNHDYSFAATPPEWTLRLNRAAAPAPGEQVVPLPGAIDSKNISKFTLNTGSGVDTIGIAESPAVLTRGLFVNSGAGQDTVLIGSLAAGLDTVASLVNLDGGPDFDTVILDNAAGTISTQFVITDSFVTRNGAPAIDYSNFENFTLKAGPGKNNVQQKSAAPGTEYDI